MRVHVRRRMHLCTSPSYYRCSKLPIGEYLLRWNLLRGALGIGGTAAAVQSVFFFFPRISGVPTRVVKIHTELGWYSSEFKSQETLERIPPKHTPLPRLDGWGNVMRRARLKLLLSIDWMKYVWSLQVWWVKPVWSCFIPACCLMPSLSTGLKKK